MVVYIIFGVLAVVYNACYSAHNIKKGNALAAAGAIFIALATCAICAWLIFASNA